MCPIDKHPGCHSCVYVLTHKSNKITAVEGEECADVEENCALLKCNVVEEMHEVEGRPQL